MTLTGPYDTDNIFAKILRGEAPCHKVFEDDVALAFLDIFPQSRGHTLVIPKTPAPNLLDFPSDALGDYMLRVQMIARGVTKTLSPDGVTVVQFNGAPAGQTVFHLHFHVIPAYEDTALAGHGQAGRADDADLAALAERLGGAMG